MSVHWGIRCPGCEISQLERLPKGLKGHPDGVHGGVEGKRELAGHVEPLALPARRHRPAWRLNPHEPDEQRPEGLLKFLVTDVLNRPLESDLNRLFVVLVHHGRIHKKGFMG